MMAEENYEAEFDQLVEGDPDPHFNADVWSSYKNVEKIEEYILSGGQKPD